MRGAVGRHSQGRGLAAGMWGVVALGLACVFAAPAPAHAEIVRLTNGVVLSVKSATVDGDAMVLVLRTGGEMRAPRAMVADVTPDEVLHAEAAHTFVLPTYVAPKAVTTVADLIDQRRGDRHLMHGKAPPHRSARRVRTLASASQSSRPCHRRFAPTRAAPRSRG